MPRPSGGCERSRKRRWNSKSMAALRRQSERSGASLKTSTIADGCTRRWATGRRTSLKSCLPRAYFTDVCLRGRGNLKDALVLALKNTLPSSFRKTAETEQHLGVADHRDGDRIRHSDAGQSSLDLRLLPHEVTDNIRVEQ